MEKTFHVHGLEDSLLEKYQFSKLDLYTQNSPSQIPSKLFYGYQQTISKNLYEMEKD